MWVIGSLDAAESSFYKFSVVAESDDRAIGDADARARIASGFDAATGNDLVAFGGGFELSVGVAFAFY